MGVLKQIPDASVREREKPMSSREEELLIIELIFLKKKGKRYSIPNSFNYQTSQFYVF